MSKTLYIFIDESGNPSTGEYYVVSGCWCLSDRDRANEVLRPTVDRLLDTARAVKHNPNSMGEIKSSSLPNDAIRALLGCLRDVEFDDGTIAQTNHPWSVTQPVRYSLHHLHPKLGNETLQNVFSSWDESTNALKTISLVSVLNPVLQAGWIDPSRFSDVRVILDAAVWQSPAERVKTGAEMCDLPFDITFDTEDSQAVPGLQMADLGAYAWARHMRSGDFQDHINKLHGIRFSDT